MIFCCLFFPENYKFRSTEDGDQPENGMSEPAEDFSTFKKAVNESICHQKDQSNVDRNEMTSTYTLDCAPREFYIQQTSLYVYFIKLIDPIDPIDLPISNEWE